MGKRCGNCANGKWIETKEAVPEICLKCEYVFGEPSNWKEKTMTNADRIRAMSDEELGMMLMKSHDGALYIPFCKDKDECFDSLDHGHDIEEEKCMHCMLDWLKQPVEKG